MKKRLLLSLFVASLISPLCAIEYYDDKKVSRIEIIVDTPSGEMATDPKPILARMKTKVGTDFSQVTFDNDLKALSEEYEEVNPEMEIKDGQLTISIHITPKPLIHSIQWKGNDQFGTSTLQEELDIKPNTIFNRQEFNKKFNKVKEYYFKKGYFESQLSYSIQYLADGSQVDITIEITEGRPGYISRIEFNGFTDEEKSDILDEMYLKKYNILTSWFTGKGVYREEALEQDRMTILTYLQNKGYADARVEISTEDDPINGKLIVNINAHRGQIYRFGKVSFQGNTFIDSQELSKKSLVETGKPFSPDKVRDTQQAIKDLYGQKGYIEASVQFESQLEEDEPIFNIDFSIDEGLPYKIGIIHIFGNSATQNHVILRESLLVPGETFDSRKLKATQQRLEAVGYFKSVNVYAVRTTDDLSLGDNYRDVYIEVEETPTGSVSLFAGFSSIDDVFGGLDLSERNFNIRGLAKFLKGDFSALRGNGEYFHIRGTAGAKQNNVLISWLNPYLNDSLWRLGVELSRTQSHLQNNMMVITWGGTVYSNYPINNYWTVGMRERARYSNDSLDLNPFDGSDEAKNWIKNLKHTVDQKGTVSAFSGNIGYDSVNDPYRPRKGWRGYLEAEIAGLGGHYNFGKISYMNKIYLPVWRKGTIKIRGDFQFIFPFGKTTNDTVPYSERLFLGGENTVRGYKNFLIGPVLYLADYQGTLHPTTTPQGGISSALFSVEYNQEIFRMLDAFAFFDAGSVSASQLTVNQIRPTIGAGLRVDIGNKIPLMIGYGFPLVAEDRHSTSTTINKWQKFFFSMAGQF